MKLHRLEIEGFGPFRERQVVDFDAFAADGIFLIAGRTGAGKSSVLDGVCFALYGGVPRYDGSEKRLRSDHSTSDDPTRVTLEFTAAGRQWRITRSPEYERPKLRGSGVTTEPHRAELSERVGDEWVGRAARPVDVGVLLDEILGLSQQQFLQVILLAQNRFARFLLAKNDERQALLRTLFGTRRFEDYEKALDERRKTAEQALAAAGESVRLHLDEAERLIAEHALGAAVREADVPGGERPGGDGHGVDRPLAEVPARPDTAAARIESGLRAVQRARYRAETLLRERATAESAQETAERSHAELVDHELRQRQRARSRAALALLEEAGESIAHDRTTLERAVAAEALRATIETAVHAEAALSVASATHADALAEWEGAGEVATDSVELAALVDAIAGDIGAWQAAAERERELFELEPALERADSTTTEWERSLARIEEQRTALPERLVSIDADVALAAPIAAALDSDLSAHAELVLRARAAREADRLRGGLEQAEAAAVAAGFAMQDASGALTALLQRRLSGYAGELAAQLVPGEPCAVCGSVEHPIPAHADSTPVTDEDVESAERAKDAAIAAERDASDVARAARVAHAEARARAGGESPETLEVAVATAEAAVARARTAADDLARLTAERSALAAAADELDAQRDRAMGHLSTARADAAVLAERVANARAESEIARGEFGTVQARIATATARRATARALESAIEARLAAERAAVAAGEDLARRVGESGFDDAVEAAASLRSVAERRTLDDRIREHETALAAERAMLLPLELAALPEEPIDLAASEERVNAARAARDAAVAAATTALHVAARLSDLVDRAAAAQDEIGVAADDHEVIARLAHTLAGRAPNTHRMTLETFVLAAELEEIVAAANLRLDEMSSGRYRLQHSDALAARGAASGLGLEIMDAYTGRTRPASSLSGGETFLASLALALGLAEVVTARAGGIRLDTLFVDEGFGSLDAETLELAMRTLDELRQGGRTVGVISHVDVMKDQIPAQLLVEATAAGPSVIHQAGAEEYASAGATGAGARGAALGA